jgi:DNA-binding MarR family transcriptional regulator
MPTLTQAQQLKEFAEEIFEVAKDVWAMQSRAKGKSHAEITETEFLALDYLLKAEQPVTVGDIQRHIGVLPAQMSRIIRALESKTGQTLVACKINPQDKRKVDVELTPAGKAAHQAYRQMKLGSTEKMLAGLSENDRAEFVRILRLIGASSHK